MKLKFCVVTSFLLGVAVLFCTPVVGEEPQDQVLRGAYVEFPPLTYTNEAGEPSGEVVELVEDLARRAGYAVRWRGLPLSRIHLYLETGEIDFWPGVSGIPLLQDLVLEPDFTPMQIRIAVYRLPDSTPVDEVADLIGHELILIRNYGYVGILDDVISHDATRPAYAPNHETGLRMLLRERGDYLISFQRPIEERVPPEMLSRVVQNTLAEQDVVILFSLANPQAARLVTEFEQAWSEREDE